MSFLYLSSAAGHPHPPHHPATNGFLSQDSCYPSTDSEWQNSEYCPFLAGDSEGGGVGERGKEQTMLEKRGHHDSEVGVNERKMVLEERIRAHVKFLSSGEYVLCLVNPQSLSWAGDCDPGMYTSTFASALGQSSLDPNLTDICKPSFIVK